MLRMILVCCFSNLPFWILFSITMNDHNELPNTRNTMIHSAQRLQIIRMFGSIWIRTYHVINKLMNMLCIYGAECGEKSMGIPNIIWDRMKWKHGKVIVLMGCKMWGLLRKCGCLPMANKSLLKLCLLRLRR